ncbi:formylglycine-generating enzyme family protein [Halioglobus maricola]|uniref:Formylglycine-generating enzyme family protein n=1 Tax=Halioglobus maricola TaxID=2601894 RepID=A0A5P9NND5_9GAMM|nr:SUMF1/EgtB/PvdO family nonheme iron enzyme [Halioglobus maricola]QFU77307.1 formylglycine-generating enzyme family protein [Halioglobus maricola]
MPTNRALILALALVGLANTPAGAEEFTAFVQPIPDSEQDISMVAVTGGSFVMGSPESETGRQDWEGPQHRVTVGDFFIGKYEINWQQYELFVYRDEDSFNSLVDPATLAGLAIDGVTGATSPYVEMSFGMGKEGFPAVNVTHYAALQYARWLSAKTGRFYRLPTEAEWEYACRAGTSTAMSFGSDAADKYAVTTDNSEEKYARTGSRDANPWGIHDMHGNVAEWTMDQFDPAFYATSPGGNPYNRPTELYPRVARGGSWAQPLEHARCAARLPSAANWKERDPQIPKSRWWLTNAPFVGFRLVSPRVQPPAAEIQRYWLEAIEDYGI